MSLADELLADLEEIGNDFGDEEIKVKEEPIEGADEYDYEAIEKMEIDESVNIQMNLRILLFVCATFGVFTFPLFFFLF